MQQPIKLGSTQVYASSAPLLPLLLLRTAAVGSLPHTATRLLHPNDFNQCELDSRLDVHTNGGRCPSSEQVTSQVARSRPWCSTEVRIREGRAAPTAGPIIAILRAGREACGTGGITANSKMPPLVALAVL